MILTQHNLCVSRRTCCMLIDVIGTMFLRHYLVLIFFDIIFEYIFSAAGLVSERHATYKNVVITVSEGFSDGFTSCRS